MVVVVVVVVVGGFTGREGFPLSRRSLRPRSKAARSADPSSGARC